MTRMGILKRFTVIFLMVILISGLNAQQITIETKIDTNQIELGRHVELSYLITKNEEATIILPVFSDTLSDGIELIAPPKVDSTRLKDGKSLIEQVLTITSFDAGNHYIESQPFILKTSLGYDTVYSKDTYLKVAGVELDTTGVIRDIANVEHVGRTFRDVLPFLIIALILGLAVIFVFVILPRIRKKRIEEEEEIQKEPAHIVALRELDKLKAQKLWQQEKLKEYYSRLTGIVRKYLENQFSVQALEETTREILRDIRLRGLDTKVNMNHLEGLLNLADLIKFAKGKADPEENIEHLENAYLLIKNTQDIVPGAQTSVQVNEDDEFMKFVFNGIQKSVENARKSSEPIVPFVLTRKRGEQKIQRFNSDDYQEAVDMAIEYLAQIQPKPDFAVIAYNGILTIEGRKSDALYIKGYDKKEQKGLVFAQRYQPVTDELEFQVIGNPALVGKEENILRQIASK